jgi:hypothetical protein
MCRWIRDLRPRTKHFIWSNPGPSFQSDAPQVTFSPGHEPRRRTGTTQRRAMAGAPRFLHTRLHNPNPVGTTWWEDTGEYQRSVLPRDGRAQRPSDGEWRCHGGSLAPASKSVHRRRLRSQAINAQAPVVPMRPHRHPEAKPWPTQRRPPASRLTHQVWRQSWPAEDGVRQRRDWCLNRGRQRGSAGCYGRGPRSPAREGEGPRTEAELPGGIGVLLSAERGRRRTWRMGPTWSVTQRSARTTWEAGGQIGLSGVSAQSQG